MTRKFTGSETVPSIASADMGEALHDHDVFAAPSVTEARREQAAAPGWQEGLIERITTLRWPEWRIDLYLGFRGPPTAEMIESEAADRGRLSTGLCAREATWEDDERISDLYADARERLGEWDVTVERSVPNRDKNGSEGRSCRGCYPNDLLSQTRIQLRPILVGFVGVVGVVGVC